MLNIKKASEYKETQINWIWDDYITSGQFHPIAISYESTKTLLAITITTLLSNNQPFPDG